MTIDIKALRKLHEKDGLVWTEDKGCVSAWSGEPDSDDCDGFNFYMGSRASIAVAARNALPALLDALEEMERERDACCDDYRKEAARAVAAEQETDRLREQGGELFLSGQVAKLREERDALQGIVDDIASETGHCLLLDDEEYEAPPLPDWVRGIMKERDAAIAKCEQLAAERPISVDMYDHVSAELEACKAKLAALVEAVESDKLPLMMTVRAALAAAKETP